jgi:hypothetical protein
MTDEELALKVVREAYKSAGVGGVAMVTDLDHDIALTGITAGREVERERIKAVIRGRRVFTQSSTVNAVYTDLFETIDN